MNVVEKIAKAMYEAPIEDGEEPTVWPPSHPDDLAYWLSRAEVAAKTMDDIQGEEYIHMKELAPEYLRERVVKYRKRTWKAEAKVDDIEDIFDDWENERVPSVEALNAIYTVLKDEE